MDLDDLAGLRHEYQDAGLDEVDAADDPIAQFTAWFAAWREVGVGEANAMVVATATPDGRPSARTVLLKGLGPEGFVFYTNYESRKGRELAANPYATLLFSWHPVSRQVIVEGPVTRVSDEMSDAYWASRPRGSRLGAAASPQSQPVPGRADLDARWAALDARYADTEIPRPPNWGGFRVRPDLVEFWQGRTNRLHDRLVYTRTDTTPPTWSLSRLAP
ncbi:MAG TPA: pyridoxamine 5'-phosphate oxidase [Acidimicrobiales bacterium]|nr:pyridoxamine 5'-phosphate oxidase [Acidimicrobiales bacterium]